VEHRPVAHPWRRPSTSLRGVEPDGRDGALGTLLGPEGTGASSTSGRPVAGASACGCLDEPPACVGRRRMKQDRP